MSQELHQPLVTVIIPNYNHAPFLEERIESVLAQDYPHVEIVLLDDHSTDSSPEILERFAAHERVSHCVLNKENSGSTFKQWKKGLELAKGDLIWIAESDDACSADFLTEAVGAFEREEKAVIFYSQSIMVNERGETIRDNKIWTDDLSMELWSADFHQPGRAFLNDYLIKKNVIPNASAVVFRKREALPFLEKVTGYKMCGDWLFWSLLAGEGGVSYSAKRMNRFRSLVQSTRHHSDINKKRLRLIEEMNVLEALQGAGLVDSNLCKTRSLDVLRRWTEIHNGSHIFDSAYYGILKHDHVHLSRIQLIKRQFSTA